VAPTQPAARYETFGEWLKSGGWTRLFGG
jgi:hypothetical protein